MTGQKIVDSTDKATSLAGEWIVALVFGVFVLPVAGIAFTSDRFFGDSGPKWIAGAFLLAGFGNLLRVTFRTLGAFKFGRIRLHLRATPIVVGGALEGELEFPKNASSLSNLVVTLVCARITWHGGSGTGAGANRSENDIWTASKRLELVAEGQGGRAALQFDIPADQPDSRTHTSSGWTVGTAETVDHAWELRLKAAAPGLNLERRFPIAVLASGHHRGR